MIQFETNQQVGPKIGATQWRTWQRKLSAGLPKKMGGRVSVAIIGKQKMQQLNYQYRGKNQVTDVLSFAEKDVTQRTPDDHSLGEIIICYPQAVRQAKQYKTALTEELERLLVHGVLHLLGFDHQRPADEKKMMALQERIIDSKL